MPNEQGGFTYEEEQEYIARQMAAANWQPPPEQNPTPEQQAQQVQNNMAAALLSQSPPEPGPAQQGLLDTVGSMVVGLGPPYAASDQPYSGPPPMEAQPDWNYDSGFPGDWHDFSGNTTTGGGFFDINELYHGAGKPVPWAFQSGSNMPSTNNWRLLPPEFRNPRYIMRNGHIINTEGNLYGPQGGSDTMGAEPGSVVPRWRSGAAVGQPVAYAATPIGWAVSGWPGQLDPYQYHSTIGI